MINDSLNEFIIRLIENKFKPFFRRFMISSPTSDGLALVVVLSALSFLGVISTSSFESTSVPMAIVITWKK